MNLIEFQGKQLLGRNGIPVPHNLYIRDEQELEQLQYPIMLKSQVLTGKRGKNGGILKAECYADAVQKYRELKNKPILGFYPLGVLAEEMVAIQQELYLSIAFNRRQKCTTMMFSEYGGMNIEEIESDKIGRTDINPLLGVQDYNLVGLLKNSALDSQATGQLRALILELCAIYQRFDLELLEINPLVITAQGQLVALDSKISMDDNCRELHKQQFDAVVGGNNPENPVEYISKAMGVNGVRLDGDIAVITSGAGVGMASIDTIKDNGGTIHSFVDLGALIYDQHALAKIFRVILDERPRAFLFNFFFQVARCDVLARAIAETLCEKPVPIVVRARGQMLEEARDILAEIDIPIIEDFTEACELVTNTMKEAGVWQSS